MLGAHNLDEWYAKAPAAHHAIDALDLEDLVDADRGARSG